MGVQQFPKRHQEADVVRPHLGKFRRPHFLGVQFLERLLQDIEFVGIATLHIR
jgi:hypothetical protein